jgi:hypothetical protein
VSIPDATNRKEETMSSYSEYTERKRREYGERFDASDLAPAFVPYFENGARVKVRFGYGEEAFGTVGATTGWKPVFLLMHNARAIGSSRTLSAADRVVAVKRGRGYCIL